MTTAVHPIKKNASLEVLAQIINAARRRGGFAALGDAELAAEVRDWSEILATVPNDRIREAAQLAWRRRTVRAIFQPYEIIEAWHELRENERAAVVVTEALDTSCYYCGGEGWQIIAKTDPGTGNESTYARGCSCNSAPIARRSLRAYCEPEYRRRRNSVIWERAV
jgi:hypothetical protein